MGKTDAASPDHAHPAAAAKPWIFDSGGAGSGEMGRGGSGEYGVDDYGTLPGDPEILRSAIPWVFSPEGGAMTMEPLVRRVGDKRAVTILVQDSLRRPCSLVGVATITLTLTPDGSSALSWIASLLEAALTPFDGAQAAVEDALAALSSDEIAVDIPTSGIAAPETDGLIVWMPTTEFDAPFSGEARLAFTYSGAPPAVLPSPAPQRMIVRK